MKCKMIQLLTAFLLISLLSCSQDKEIPEQKKIQTASNKKAIKEVKPHRYGGWYCPDNLNGFPPVDIADWNKVPVVNGRMATKEETQTSASLIYVDTDQYPDAKPLDITVPKLATFFNSYSKREELIIVIQAIEVANDSIVGFRYLNGGNGSARLHEVQFLDEQEINAIKPAQFVTLSVNINAPQNKVWETLVEARNGNFYNPEAGPVSASYADKLFGNYYIQNDFENSNYTEKFLLLEDPETKKTELKIACGPYSSAVEMQRNTLTQWANKIKQMSEGKL